MDEFLRYACDLVYGLWPAFQLVFIWFGIGMLGWFIGSLAGFVGYHSFRDGFHTQYELVLLGPVTLILVFYLFFHKEKD